MYNSYLYYFTAMPLTYELVKDISANLNVVMRDEDIKKFVHDEQTNEIEFRHNMRIFFGHLEQKRVIMHTDPVINKYTDTNICQYLYIFFQTIHSLDSLNYPYEVIFHKRSIYTLPIFLVVNSTILEPATMLGNSGNCAVYSKSYMSSRIVSDIYFTNVDMGKLNIKINLNDLMISQFAINQPIQLTQPETKIVQIEAKPVQPETKLVQSEVMPHKQVQKLNRFANPIEIKQHRKIIPEMNSYLAANINSTKPINTNTSTKPFNNIQKPANLISVKPLSTHTSTKPFNNTQKPVNPPNTKSISTNTNTSTNTSTKQLNKTHKPVNPPSTKPLNKTQKPVNPANTKPSDGIHKSTNVPKLSNNDTSRLVNKLTNNVTKSNTKSNIIIKSKDDADEPTKPDENQSK